VQYLYFKRIIDILLSLFLLIFFAPLLLLIAFLISTTSRGNVIFKQKRSGKNKRLFLIYKFRTMAATTPADVAKNMLDTPERYITAIGSFLRKASLDELPQLLNILKGEMSFIGPRPALWTENELIDIRHKEGITTIKPGLSGLAQINGRDALSLDEKIRFDKLYHDNISFALDLRIFVKTPVYVLKGKDILKI
jgi:O-antigen biosynthesis protein WbqP